MPVGNGFIRRHNYDEPPPEPPDFTVNFQPNTVDHDPTLDDLRARIHRGALGVIRTYGRDPQYARLVLAARRILEHDCHNARSPEQHAEYTNDLRDAILGCVD